LSQGSRQEPLEELEELAGVRHKGRGKALAGQGKEGLMLDLPGGKNGLELKPGCNLDGEI
jgi:hypothetical protein